MSNEIKKLNPILMDLYIELLKAWFNHQEHETVESYKRLTGRIDKVRTYMKNNDDLNVTNFFIDGSGWGLNFPFKEVAKTSNEKYHQFVEDSISFKDGKFINIDLESKGVDQDINNLDELKEELEKKYKEELNSNKEEEKTMENNTNNNENQTNQEEAKMNQEQKQEQQESKKEETKKEETKSSCTGYKIATGVAVVAAVAGVGLGLWNLFHKGETTIINVDDI